MEKHQIYAIGIFAAIAIPGTLKNGFSASWYQYSILLAFLLPILLYKVIAFFAAHGIPEYFARDYGSRNHPGPYALFFWMLYLVACAFILFDWSLY